MRQKKKWNQNVCQNRFENLTKEVEGNQSDNRLPGAMNSSSTFCPSGKKSSKRQNEKKNKINK